MKTVLIGRTRRRSLGSFSQKNALKHFGDFGKEINCTLILLVLRIGLY
jgi:hypothetical protein